METFSTLALAATLPTRENGGNDGLAEVNEIGVVEGTLIGPYEEGDAEYDWPLG